MMDRKHLMSLGAMAAIVGTFGSINSRNTDRFLDEFVIAPRRFMGKPVYRPADPKKKAQRKAQGKARARSRK